MAFYLETASPKEFSEINQYLSLEGVVVPARGLLKEHAKVNGTIAAMLEFMSEHQKLFLPVISAGFRAMFAEARKTAALSRQIVVMIPASNEGLMCLKACKTLNIPCVLTYADSMLLAAFGHENHAKGLIMSYDKLEENCEPAKAICAACRKFAGTRVMTAGFSSLGQINKVLMETDADVVIPYGLAGDLFYHWPGKAVLDELRLDWINEYMRVELTGEDEEEENTSRQED